MRELRVVRSGPLTTVQDLGRPGLAHLGVPRSGAADRSSLRLANRLVGNRESAAALEITLGGLHVVPSVDLVVAVTGADCPITLDATPAPRQAVLQVDAGTAIRIGTARAGLRAYLAVRAGLAADVVLGSRSTDTLSGLGPPVVQDGDSLTIGPADGPDVVGWPSVDVAAVHGTWSTVGPAVGAGPALNVSLHATWGPRTDWFTPAARALLRAASWQVSAQSDRVGLRLEGRPIERARQEELPSEGLVRGAVQVPPSGLPVLFLADHPVTGGYPVIAVLRDHDVDRAAQLRPGQRIALHLPSEPRDDDEQQLSVTDE